MPRKSAPEGQPCATRPHPSLSRERGEEGGGGRVFLSRSSNAHFSVPGPFRLRSRPRHGVATSAPMATLAGSRSRLARPAARDGRSDRTTVAMQRSVEPAPAPGSAATWRVLYRSPGAPLRCALTHAAEGHRAASKCRRLGASRTPCRGRRPPSGTDPGTAEIAHCCSSTRKRGPPPPFPPALAGRGKVGAGRQAALRARDLRGIHACSTFQWSIRDPRITWPNCCIFRGRDAARAR